MKQVYNLHSSLLLETAMQKLKQDKVFSLFNLFIWLHSLHNQERKLTRKTRYGSLIPSASRIRYLPLNDSKNKLSETLKWRILLKLVGNLRMRMSQVLEGQSSAFKMLYSLVHLAYK